MATIFILQKRHLRFWPKNRLIVAGQPWPLLSERFSRKSRPRPTQCRSLWPGFSVGRSLQSGSGLALAALGVVLLKGRFKGHPARARILRCRCYEQHHVRHAMSFEWKFLTCFGPCLNGTGLLLSKAEWARSRAQWIALCEWCMLSGAPRVFFSDCSSCFDGHAKLERLEMTRLSMNSKSIADMCLTIMNFRMQQTSPKSHFSRKSHGIAKHI